MNLSTIRKFETVILYLMIISLPINCLPKEVSIPFLGQNLAHYVFILAVLLLVYEYISFPFKISKSIIIFFSIYTMWQILCNILGLINYPYNYLLTIEQIPKLELILKLISEYGYHCDDIVAIKCWIFFRNVKTSILFSSIAFVISYYVYHIYGNRFNECFIDIRKACTFLVIVMGVYSAVELAWLKFSCESAKNILVTINPYLYDIGTTNTWWPPLLWSGQLRSITREPSFFGIISAMILPFIWSYIFERRIKIKYVFLLMYFVLMIAATNSRTAIIIMLAQIVLLILSCTICMDRIFIKRVIAVFFITLCGFSLNFIDFNMLIKEKDVYNVRVYNVQVDTQLSNYVEDNVTSITKTNVRSNGARLANLIANCNVIKEYPFFGVGSGLENAYIYDHMPGFGKHDSEVQLWGKDMLEKGVLVSVFPATNGYVDVAVANGLLGLLMFLLPVIYIFVNIAIYRVKFFKSPYCIVALISMLGLLAARFSSAGFIECSGFIWGLLFCSFAYIKTERVKQ